MTDKNKIILALIAVLGWSAMAFWWFTREETTKEISKKTIEIDTLYQPSHYKKIPLRAFKCVEIQCDLGPVTVYVEAADKHAIEFHQSIMKYAEISFRGDTLVVHTLKTPKSTADAPIYRQMYIYTPEITYYKAAATASVIRNFKEKQLEIDSWSSSVRMKSCIIENLNLYTDHACTYLIDRQNLFKNVYASITPNSSFACYGTVDNYLTLKSDNMKQIHFSKNVRNLKLVKWKLIAGH